MSGRITVGLRNIGLMALVGAVMWLRYTDSLSTDERLAYVVVAIAILALVLVIPSYYRSTRIVSNAPLVRPVDVSERGLLPTNKSAQEIIAQLNRIGFTRLGEISTTIPGMGEGITWLLANPSRTIVAEVVEIQDGMLQFTTVFEDLATIETSFPNGEDITKPNYYARKNTTGLEPCFKAHVSEAKKLTEVHKRPRPIKSIEAYLKWDIIYRERYIQYKVKSDSALKSTLIFIGIVIALAVSVVLLGS